MIKKSVDTKFYQRALSIFPMRDIKYGMDGIGRAVYEKESARARTYVSEFICVRARKCTLSFY